METDPLLEYNLRDYSQFSNSSSSANRLGTMGSGLDIPGYDHSRMAPIPEEPPPKGIKCHNPLDTVNSLLRGYNSLSVSTLLRPLSPEFKHQVLPASLGMPLSNRDAFSKHAAGIFAIFSSFKMIPLEIFSISGGKEIFIIRAEMRGVLKNGGGNWRNECVMFIRLSEDCSQVVEITEFVDSRKAVEMRERHAPANFDTKKPRAVGSWSERGMVAFGWLVFCLLITKLGGHVLALLLFWAHPLLHPVVEGIWLAYVN